MKSVLLLMTSMGLIGTWVYHLYDKTEYSKRRTEVFIKDSTAVAEAVTDSLHKMYSYAITDLDSRLSFTKGSADSLESELQSSVGQINTLKKEISDILNKKGVTREELAIARRKIAELQQMVDDLRNQNSSIEQEKNRLNGMMETLTGEITGLQQNMKRVEDENRVLVDKLNLASTFFASDLKLSPVTVRNEKEEETSQAKKVSKLVVSFSVQNNVSDDPGSEVYVVITQPDGKVIRNDVWETGTMNTRTEGKKSYTQKLRFEYLKGSVKPILFSINAPEYQKGNYAMQVYHNGMMIGKVSKTLR
jgi:uncharacterized phage infection (PIP) family protein YhgE